MEELFSNVGAQGDTADHEWMNRYFESLKNNPHGHRICLQALENMGMDDRAKFLCFQVLEHYIKNKYAHAPLTEQTFIREFLIKFIGSQRLRNCPTYVRNKIAQIYSLVFVREYPATWPTFFSDMLKSLAEAEDDVDLYLRILLAIDCEVADKDLHRTELECRRNSVIKNAMRETFMQEMVESWYQILRLYHEKSPSVVVLCLSVIGAYISWIDINLVANDNFVAEMIKYLSDKSLRDASMDCVLDIISKGMEPLQKARLIESFSDILQPAIRPLLNDESDFSVRIAKLINGMGTFLIESFNKLSKSGNESEANWAMLCAEAKMPLMLECLGSDYDDMSSAVTEFGKEYCHVLKTKPMLTEHQRKFTEQMTICVIKKMKYDETYNFNREGEDEISFQEFRKQLKILFDNLVALDQNMVMAFVKQVAQPILASWATYEFNDMEHAIYLLYLMGEALPSTSGNYFVGDEPLQSGLREMMISLVDSGISNYSHPAVSLQFFETVARYDKFFHAHTQYVGSVIFAFLDNRGMGNFSSKVRSRCSYLFCRVVKFLKAYLQPYTEGMVARIQDLIALSSPVAPTQDPLLSQDDLLFVYEAVGVLIVSSSYEPQYKTQLLTGFLEPLLNQFMRLVPELSKEDDLKQQESIAQNMCHIMAVVSRTSKAFSNHQTMRACGCDQAYLQALNVFLSSLQVEKQQTLLQNGVRQFLHRMVVCLEENLLPFIPLASERLLNCSDARSIQEYIPLIIQIITKFKKEIIPFLQIVVVPIIEGICSILFTHPVVNNDEQERQDRIQLQRNMHIFIGAIVSNNVTEVLVTQTAEFQEAVLTTTATQAIDFADPMSQKACFATLRKLIETLCVPDGPASFIDFAYHHIVPACFMAPMKETFDLSDTQTQSALNESAMCLHLLQQRLGAPFVNYLRNQYLPSLNLSSEAIEKYCNALQSEPKDFKKHVKNFFAQAKKPPD